MKLAICRIFSGGYQHGVPVPFLESMEALQVEILTGRTPVTSQARLKSEAFPIDVARNELCQKALDWGADKVLFLDCDHVFEPEAAIRLIASDHAVVSGRYHVKKPPYHANLYVRPKGAHTPGHFQTVHYGSGVFPVDRCGAGALAVTAGALEAVGYPWFRYGPQPEPPHDLGVSEDFFFCERLQQEGVAIWADWDATFGHLSPLGGLIDEHQRAEYLRSVEAEIAGEQPHLAEKMIACGYPDGYMLASGHVVPPYDRRDTV